MALLHFSTFISFKEIEREISSRWLKTKTYIEMRMTTANDMS